MFYLANDVVQHAKRKGDSTVLNQWAVAVQKATPHVRTPSSVSSAIIRIFKIWEERAVYSKDTVADLVALISKRKSASCLIPAKCQTRDVVQGTVTYFSVWAVALILDSSHLCYFDSADRQCSWERQIH